MSMTSSKSIIYVVVSLCFEVFTARFMIAKNIYNSRCIQCIPTIRGSTPRYKSTTMAADQFPVDWPMSGHIHCYEYAVHWWILSCNVSFNCNYQFTCCSAFPRSPLLDVLLIFPASNCAVCLGDTGKKSTIALFLCTQSMLACYTYRFEFRGFCHSGEVSGISALRSRVQ